MTDVKRKQVKKFLIIFFPDVLADIIIEYSVQIKHKCRLIKTTARNHKGICCVGNDNKIYEYKDEQVTSKTIDEINDLTNPLQIMCMYEKDIYVFDDDIRSMHVFDRDCKKLRTFEMPTNIIYGSTLTMVIAAGKIFINRVYQTFIVVADLQGKFIMNIDLQNEMLIYITSDNNYLYVITKSEHELKNFIYKYSFDCDLIEKYNSSVLDGSVIDEFFIVNDMFYLTLITDSQKDIYEYENNTVCVNVSFKEISTSMNIRSKISNISLNNNFLIACSHHAAYIFGFEQ